MATIRNSISLQDRMSPVFRSIIKSMDSTLKVMKNLDQQTNKGIQSKAYKAAERDIQRANNALIKMQNNLDKVDSKAVKMSGSFSSMSSKVTGLASSLYLLKNAMNAISNGMSIPDELRSIQYRLETYDTTPAAGNQLFDETYLAAQRSRSELSSTANLASRILVSGATDGNGAEAIRLAEILNKASFLGGSSAGESQRALLQLSQGLASGTLQGDELRAIREQAPGLTDTLAKGLSSLAEKGVLPDKFINTSMGDLKELGSQGELTADRIIAAFNEMGQYVDTMFEESPKQFGQAVTGIANVWKRWLKLMAQGDNALARINEAMWDLKEWFDSDSGQRFMENLAVGINFVTDAIFGLLDGAGRLIQKFSELEESTRILQSAIVAFGVVAGGTLIGIAVKSAIAWVTAAWPILLVVALIGSVVYAALWMGATVGDVVGAIVGSVIFAVYLIWDLVVWLVTIILDTTIALGTGIILIIQGIVQIILWLITTIWAVIVTIYNALYTLIATIYAGISTFIIGIYSDFVDLGTNVLDVLSTIASAIDTIFGSNLASSVNKWIGSLDSSVLTLEQKLDPTGAMESIGEQWKSSYQMIGDMYAGRGKYDDWNIVDNMADVVNGAGNILNTINGAASSITADPLKGFDTGWKFGHGLTAEMENVANQFSNASRAYTDGVTVDGGQIDSIGSIKSDVEISDEDIQLLRDMAAREFLLNIQTITPQANISFGDVRETADVNKILEVIQDMVDEQLATSMVVG